MRSPQARTRAVAAGSSGREEQEETSAQGFPPARADSSRLPGAPASNSGSGGMREGAEEAEGLDVRWRECLILELPPDAEQEEVHTLSSCFLQHMIARAT